MALSFKKKTADAAPAIESQTDADGAYSIDTDDTLTPAEMQSGAVAARASVPPVRAARPTGLKGAVVGLNIGAAAIKVVELQGKGRDFSVTALGSIPTPPDSISDGVVMNQSALSNAVQQLLREAGIKTRRIVSSVSGATSLVVRVIEVPRMSDSELADNMKVDLDRYIPFAPNEVRHSFVALRELPSDPDSPNMEVLLAAARNETIDQHVDVVEGAKLAPSAIDVEPLAAARSLAYIDGSNNTDFGTATALINIGALSTEISVLRGDILVFTRTIPGGSSAFTQAIADKLGLSFEEAETVKLQYADALEPQPEPVDVAAHAPNDWTSGSVSTQSAADDPFSPDFFAGGARQSEPGEQHQQRQEPDGKGELPKFDDSSDFGLDFDLLPAQGAAGEPSNTAPTKPLPEDLDFDDFDSFGIPSTQLPIMRSDDEADLNALPSINETDAEALNFPEARELDVAPSGKMFSMGASDDPALPSFPTLPNMQPMGMSGIGTPEEEDELEAIPTAHPEDDEEPVAADEPIEFSFDAIPSVTGASNSLADTSVPSAYDFAPTAAAPAEPVVTQDVSAPPAPPTAPGAAPTWATASADDLTTPVTQVEAAPTQNADDIFDLDSLLQPVAGGAAATGASATLDPFAPATPSPISLQKEGTPETPFAATPAPAMDDFGAAFGAGFLGDDTAVNATNVYRVMHPQLDELIAEVRRSLEFYSSRYPDAPAERIILVGGGAKMRNIDAAFTQALGIPSVIGNPLAHLSVKAGNGASIVENDGPTYAVALGLALRDLV